MSTKKPSTEDVGTKTTRNQRPLSADQKGTAAAKNIPNRQGSATSPRAAGSAVTAVMSRSSSRLLSRQPSDLLQRQTPGESESELDGEVLRVATGGRNFAQLGAAPPPSDRPLIQAKLTVGPAGDKYEQEAERTAAQVVRQISSSPGRQPVEASPGDPLQREMIPDEELQMQPILQRAVGLEGGPVSADIEGTIERAKGGGQPLAPGLQESMGQAMGADFSGVRVHSDGESHSMNESIQAKAFTTGQDLFFRQGAYEPGSRGGQELIAHELTHVVQQSGPQVIAPFRESSQDINTKNEQTAVGVSPAPDISRQDQSIQRVEADVLITGVSHLVKMVKGTIHGGAEVQEIIHGQQLTVETESEINSRRGPNQEEFAATDKSGPQHYKWYKVISIEGKKAPKDLYVRQDVFVFVKQESGTSTLDQAEEVVGAITSVPGTLIGNEGVTGAADALNDKTVHTDTGGGVDSQGNPTASESDLTHARNMGIVGDSITGITGLLGLAKGFKDLGNAEQTAAETFVTFMEIEQGAMKTGESVSKLVNTLGEGGASGTLAKGLGSGFEGYGAAFGGIKEGFLAMKGYVNLIRNHQDYSTEENARIAAEASLHALEGAKSVVLSIKSFIELVEGSASGGLMAAVPGLDIAISAVRLIMDGYYLAISNASRKVMNERRQEIATEKDLEKDNLVSASEFYRTKDAEIANLREVIRDDNARLAKNPGKDASKLKKRIKKSEEKIRQLEKEVAAEKISREAVAEFSLVTELRDANTKRVTRQSIHIATEMAKIAGSIATLTGVGAMGGAITKGAASAVDLSLPAARMAKQAGRNRAARKLAKGKKDKSISVFDHTKSTAAKADFRLKQVKYLIRLIVNLSHETDSEARVKSAANIKAYLKAADVNESKLFKKNGDPQAQIKMLVEAIQKREFL